MAYGNEDFIFGLRKCIIAPWLEQSNWGAAVQLESCEIFSSSLIMVKDELHGDDMVTALAAATISGTLQVQFGFKSLSIWNTLTGMTVTDATTYKTAVQPIGLMPYFGISGQAYMQNGLLPHDLFIPKCKITGNLGYELNFGKLRTQRLDCQFIYDSTTWGFLFQIDHGTTTTLTIPPTET